MKNQVAHLKGLVPLLAGLLFAASVPAQTLYFLNTAPVPTNGDVYNLTGALHDGANVSDGAAYADGAANDAFTYVSTDRPSQGQTFTTGPTAGQVTAVWVRQPGYTTNADATWWGFNAGGQFVVRITDPSQVNNAGFVLDSETYTITGTEPNWPGNAYQNSPNGPGTWIRFALSNNVVLSPNTVYGFDVTSLSAPGTPDFFESWGTSNNVYAGGEAYQGSTNGAVDNTLNPLVGDRAFLIEFGGFTNPPVIPPTITNQPANTMVPEGANGVFTVGASGTPPFSYQWYFNTNTVLTGRTNATLALAAAPSTVGSYSVVVTNDGGSATSSVVRLACILPSYTTNLNFSTGDGSILDVNGVSTPFSVRLGGTGSSIPTDDPYLYMNGGVLDVASTTYDFNGQLTMDQADAIGVNLSSLIGFTGSQDFAVTAVFTNLTASINYDQAGVFAGTASTNFARGGLIFNSDFANLSSYGVATAGSNDLGIATGPAPVDQMVATIARGSGVWSMNVNGYGVTPNYSLAFLDSETDLTVGVFSLNTSGTQQITAITAFSASTFNAPKLSATPSGGSLTFDWNVLSQGLESSTNLSDPNSWTLVPKTANTNQLIMSLPATGAKFYRIAL